MTEAEDWEGWEEEEEVPAPLAPPPADATEALAQLHALAEPEKAAELAAYHKAPRPYLGVPVPQIEALTRDWRQGMDLDARLALAADLWASNVHEGRIAAARLLTQARIRPDEDVWQMFCAWVPDFDAWAIADHACKAGERRLMADLSRLDQIELWLDSPSVWTRRASLVVTQPLTKLNHPKPAEIAARERVLGWIAALADDPDPFLQKAIGGWLRDLARHDPARVRAFLEDHGARLKPATRKDAARPLK